MSQYSNTFVLNDNTKYIHPQFSRFFPSTNMTNTTYNEDEPILVEVVPDPSNVPHENENVEELCTGDCHSNNCTCELNHNDNDNDTDDDNDDDDDNDNDVDVDVDVDDDVDVDVDDGVNINYNTLDEEIKKIQSELEQKLKIQLEYKQRLEREHLQREKEENERKRKEREEQENKLKSEKRAMLVEKINKIVSEYNEQQKHCDNLLKTYNSENHKLTQLNLEYYKLKHQLDSIEKPQADFDSMNSFLFPFLNLMNNLGK